MVKFEEGKKSGRHLAAKLVDTGVIPRLRDGTYNYNRLVRIMVPLGMQRQCEKLVEIRGE